MFFDSVIELLIQFNILSCTCFLKVSIVENIHQNCCMICYAVLFTNVSYFQNHCQHNIVF